MMSGMRGGGTQGMFRLKSGQLVRESSHLDAGRR